MDEQFYRKPQKKSNVLGLLKKIFKKKSVRITLLIIIPALFFMMFSNRGLLKRLSLEAEKKAMGEKIRQAQQEQLQLEAQSKALDNDPKAIEKVAREKYGLIREGETVYKVKEK